MQRCSPAVNHLLQGQKEDSAAARMQLRIEHKDTQYSAQDDQGYSQPNHKNCEWHGEEKNCWSWLAATHLLGCIMSRADLNYNEQQHYYCNCSARTLMVQ